MVLRAGACWQEKFPGIVPYGLFADSLYGGATDYPSRYPNTEGFQLAQKLWRHWCAKYPQPGPEGVYGLIDDFADMLGLRNSYEWCMPAPP